MSPPEEQEHVEVEGERDRQTRAVNDHRPCPSWRWTTTPPCRCPRCGETEKVGAFVDDRDPHPDERGWCGACKNFFPVVGPVDVVPLSALLDIEYLVECVGAGISPEEALLRIGGICARVRRGNAP